jgi:hypothetical protein
MESLLEEEEIEYNMEYSDNQNNEMDKIRNLFDTRI